jgi:enoyl-CoA hydratase/carnithine racemase
MEGPMPEVLEVKKDGHVMTMTISRPKVRNALDEEVAVRIAAAIDDLEVDRELRVGILYGAGGVFSSGMDLKAFGEGKLPVVEGRGLAGFAEAPPAKPLIAAVEGYALAGGFEMMLACDLTVAASDASFGIPEVRRGLIAAGGGLIRLPRRIPYALAAELALTGEMIGAGRCAELGLVNRVVEPGTALREAENLAAQIAANAPLAVVATKQVLGLATETDEAKAWRRQEPIADGVSSSADAGEGARAFVEKRKPVWQGL